MAQLQGWGGPHSSRFSREEEDNSHCGERRETVNLPFGVGVSGGPRRLLCQYRSPSGPPGSWGNPSLGGGGSESAQAGLPPPQAKARTEG